MIENTKLRTKYYTYSYCNIKFSTHGNHLPKTKKITLIHSMNNITYCIHAIHLIHSQNKITPCSKGKKCKNLINVIYPYNHIIVSRLQIKYLAPVQRKISHPKQNGTMPDSTKSSFTSNTSKAECNSCCPEPGH